MTRIPSDRQEIFYQLALCQVENLGVISVKRLIRHFGSAREVFNLSSRELMQVPGMNVIRAMAIANFHDFADVEKNIEFSEKEGHEIISFLDPTYPNRLTHCEDSPVVLFKKGNADLSAKRMVSVVGTRKISPYGKDITRELIESMVPYNITVVSGLAYGVDIEAHKACIELSLPTIGVLGHGLDALYPNSHIRHAKKMIENGALLTEFGIKTRPDRENFPMRNRIVAGMTDATIVVESGASGGSIITANLANGYNRDVFAIPGRIHDSASEGCNRLIKSNKAALLESAKDLEYIMGWTKKEGAKAVQTKIFVDLSPDEEKVLKAIRESGKIQIDALSLGVGIPMSMVMVHLLNLELNGLVRSHPGKIYEFI